MTGELTVYAFQGVPVRIVWIKPSGEIVAETRHSVPPKSVIDARSEKERCLCGECCGDGFDMFPCTNARS